MKRNDRNKWVARAALGFALGGTLPGQVDAQSVQCQLMAHDSASFVGNCHVGSTTVRVELHRPVGPTDVLWEGTMTGGDPMPIEIATYQYSAGPELIVRTGAWHALDAFSVSAEGLTLAWDESVEASPSQTDLNIFLTAREFLSDESKWDREDDRDCENDESLISLYCALARATATEMGRYQHRQPAMQAVRRVIGTEWPERVVNHRLMNFNNDPRTTLADVHSLFDLAEESLRRSIR